MFVWSCALLWSAFSFVGILPFLLVAIWKTRGQGLFSFQNTVGSAVILGFTALFISSNDGAYPHGWLWEFQNVLRTWPTLALYYAVSFGMYAVLCPRVDRSGPGDVHPIWWWTAIACLLLVPWYHLGKFNDFSIKTGIPAIVVLQIYLVTAIAKARTESQRTAARVLVFLILIGTFSNVTNVTRAISHGLHLSPTPLARVKHVNGFGPAAKQLFSDGNYLFWRVFAKQPELQ